MSFIKSEKKENDLIIYKVVIVGKTEISFVAQRGDVFSHGKTKEDSILDLEFKLGERDTSQYRKWKQDEQRSILEMVLCYRRITGACRQGVEEFIKNIKDKKESYSPKEVIELTNGHFGYEQFRAFFEAANGQ